MDDQLSFLDSFQEQSSNKEIKDETQNSKCNHTSSKNSTKTTNSGSVQKTHFTLEDFRSTLANMEEPAQIQILREKLLFWNQKYYQESVSEIPDTDYDFLMKQLEALEKKHPELESSSSPTQRVGGSPVESLTEVTHKVVMLSIENVYEPEGVLRFAETVYRHLPQGTVIPWVLELKIDGVAISLHYRKGELVQAVTRGDGRKGNDVTHNVRTIPDVPLELKETDPRYPIPEEVEIRGEVYMTNSGLSLLNERQKEMGRELYANPRNAASGSILLHDPKICAQRPLRLFCHSVGMTETLPCKSHSEFLEAITSWGLIATPDVQHFLNVSEAVAYCEANQDTLFSHDFEVDGFVLKVDDFALRKALDETLKSSKYPGWLIALKFQKYEAVTKLLEIRTQVGKTGVITPVAELEPIQLAGTIVSRSSLHNADEIRRKDIRVGDFVVVEKAGKIIPHIVRSEIHRREHALPEYQFPTKCPVCGATLIQDEGGVYIRCSNAHCPARWNEKILYFGSRDAMNIKGLGTKLGKQLLDRGFVTSYADLYRLEDILTPEKIRSLDRVGDRMAANLCDAIRNSKKRGLARLLTALSIPHLGKETAELLAMRFLTMDALLGAELVEIVDVDGIGGIIADSVWQYLHSEDGLKAIEDLKSVGVLMDFVDENGRLAAATRMRTPSVAQSILPLEPESDAPTGPESGVQTSESGVQTSESGVQHSDFGVQHSESSIQTDEKGFSSEDLGVPLAGQTVVVTGKLEHFSRDKIESLIMRLGGKPTSSVSAKTSFLIAGADAGSKLKKAHELGVPVLTEEEFCAQYDPSNHSISTM